MKTMSKMIGLLALSAAAFATPSMAQTLSIGPDGVRVLEERPGRPDRPERRDDRGRGEVSEREAVRIARGEGLREVEDVRRTRSSYRIEGLDRRGDDIRVDVDRRSGAVIDVR
ncbi:hypothetical protein ASG43_10560 [Aureimonas sp. Leaf454]|uniref:PepSY domain-containing protein n=1 Tax=Aureimonas sp. Leaf454 TaxID=1736381 RepID=UPI0007016DC0|nr:PepSY domain-containing protein [Aureimonas sp. Leaf454]KQT47523.1 hypothetical protein ASG43_10560 [Aureimonas sp. Leaf454]